MVPVQPQYTFDQEGNPVGVFIPIDEWNEIVEHLPIELPDWQKALIDSRLAMLKSAPENLLNWEELVAEMDAEDEAL